jgi:predicted house-cleaning NTP pyrophosphatase (Maf/HAM1 superfamily)
MEQLGLPFQVHVADIVEQSNAGETPDALVARLSREKAITVAARHAHDSDLEIAAYVASGDPMDKAGAYGIQNAQFHPVSRLRGCYASVMGLPLCRLAELLSLAGLTPPNDIPAACSALTMVRCCGGQERTLVY